MSLPLPPWENFNHTLVEVSGETVEGMLHFSQIHFLMEDFPSQTKIEASGEGSFSVTMNISSNVLFQEESWTQALTRGVYM